MSNRWSSKSKRAQHRLEKQDQIYLPKLIGARAPCLDPFWYISYIRRIGHAQRALLNERLPSQIFNWTAFCSYLVLNNRWTEYWISWFLYHQRYVEWWPSNGFMLRRAKPSSSSFYLISSDHSTSTTTANSIIRRHLIFNCNLWHTLMLYPIYVYKSWRE